MISCSCWVFIFICASNVYNSDTFVIGARNASQTYSQHTPQCFQHRGGDCINIFLYLVSVWAPGGFILTNLCSTCCNNSRGCWVVRFSSFLDIFLDSPFAQSAPLAYLARWGAQLSFRTQALHFSNKHTLPVELG